MSKSASKGLPICCRANLTAHCVTAVSHETWTTLTDLQRSPHAKLRTISHFTLSVFPSSSPVAAWTTSHPPGECTRIPTWVSRFPPSSVTKRLSKLVPVLNMRSHDSHATESESDTEDGTIRWRQEQKTIPVTRKHTFFIKRRGRLLLMKKF